MFVPRQVQKKPVSKQSVSTSKPSTRPSPVTHKSTEGEPSVRDNVDIVAAREAVMALEILMSDYSLGRSYGNWLSERMRDLDGKDDYIHLSTFLDCRYLSRIKPKMSQVSLKKALIECKSDVLELSADKYHVRRKTKPSFSRGENQDKFTIYIEPNITGIILNPGKVARILSEAQLPQKYFPIQFVENTEKSWAFVTLSSPISEVDATNKKLWPDDWIVLTKSEWQRRDTEYQQLRQALLRIPFPHNQSLSHKTMPAKGDIFPRLGNVDQVENLPQYVHPSFEIGLIVRLTNLHPSTTKAAITSFIYRSVDRYLRKKAKKQGKKKDDLVASDVRAVKINYVDYEKGLNRAYIRQSNQADSELIAKSLRKRKRNMRDGEDIKGKKTGKAENQGWVKGDILVGEEERIYWEKLLLAKNTKGKGKGKNGRKEKLTAPDLGTGTKRVRKDSEVSSSNIPKRIKFDQ